MQAQLLKEEFQKNSIGNAIYSMIKDFLEIEKDIMKATIRKAIDAWEALKDKSIVIICELGPTERIEIMIDIFSLIKTEYQKNNDFNNENSINGELSKALSNYIKLESHPMINSRSSICAHCN